MRLKPIGRWPALAATSLIVVSGTTAALAQVAPIIRPIPTPSPSAPTTIERPSVPGAPARLREVSRPELPLLVGGTAGYAFRLNGMALDAPLELGSGFSQGRTTAPPVLAQGPRGELISLVAGQVPQVQKPLPEPHWESLSLPPTYSMVVSGGALYGVDHQNYQVYRYDLAGGDFRTIGTQGTGPGQFTFPEHVAVDRAGRIYVSDKNRIVRMDDISGGGWTVFGSAGSATGQFNWIRGLAVDGRGRIYAADANNNKVVRIDDMTGKGWTERSFSSPNCVATDRYNRIYVCEAESWRLSRLDDLDGTGLVTIQAERGSAWKYGSFGHVTPLAPTGGGGVIR